MDTKNECEDESRNVVQWVQHCVSQKHIKNGDVEQFVMHHDNRIWCPNELLVTVFYRDAEFEKFKIYHGIACKLPS